MHSGWIRFHVACFSYMRCFEGLLTHANLDDVQRGTDTAGRSLAVVTYMRRPRIPTFLR